MLLENQIQQIDDPLGNTVSKIELAKNPQCIIDENKILLMGLRVYVNNDNRV
jgi:hypothetical protein